MGITEPPFSEKMMAATKDDTHVLEVARGDAMCMCERVWMWSLVDRCIIYFPLTSIKNEAFGKQYILR